MKGPSKVDVCVLGAGIAGLWIALLARLAGYRVIVLETQRKLGGKASLHNEGWLHSGPFHSATIDRRDIAIAVAESVRAGTDQYLALARSSILTHKTIALIPSQFCDFVIDRWTSCHLAFTRTSYHLSRKDMVPFEVSDRSINTSLAASALVNLLQALGVVIVPNALPRVDVQRSGIDCERVGRVEARIVVHASGAALTSIQSETGFPATRFRQFKSHLCDLLLRLPHNVFTVREPEGVNAFNHGEVTVAGLPCDQHPISPDEVPTPDPGIESAFRHRLKEFLGIDVRDMRVRCCIKVDVEAPVSFDPYESPSGGLLCRPQLGWQFGKLSESHWYALPGKFTAAPIMAQAIVNSFLDLFPPSIRPSKYVGCRPFDLIGSVQ